MKRSAALEISSRSSFSSPLPSAVMEMMEKRGFGNKPICARWLATMISFFCLAEVPGDVRAILTGRNRGTDSGTGCSVRPDLRGYGTVISVAKPRC